MLRRIRGNRNAELDALHRRLTVCTSCGALAARIELNRILCRQISRGFRHFFWRKCFVVNQQLRQIAVKVVLHPGMSSDDLAGSDSLRSKRPSFRHMFAIDAECRARIRQIVAIGRQRPATSTPTGVASTRPDSTVALPIKPAKTCAGKSVGLNSFSNSGSPICRTPGSKCVAKVTAWRAVVVEDLPAPAAHLFTAVIENWHTKATV